MCSLKIAPLMFHYSCRRPAPARQSGGLIACCHANNPNCAVSLISQFLEVWANGGVLHESHNPPEQPLRYGNNFFFLNCRVATELTELTERMGRVLSLEKKRMKLLLCA